MLNQLLVYIIIVIIKADLLIIAESRIYNVNIVENLLIVRFYTISQHDFSSEKWNFIATHTNGFTYEYRKKYERFEELQSELDREKAEYESAQARYKQLQDIIQTLKGDVLTEFDDRVWNAVIANVTVFHDGSMVFQFKDGTEIKE